MLRASLSAVVLAMVLGCGSSDDGDPGAGGGPAACEPADRPLACGRHLNIAHRGGALLAPEDTMVAFEHAAGLDVDALELDVHATADGAMVVIHDEEVDRTTDGTGAVADMTLAELQQLDAAYHFTTDNGQTFPYRGQGVVIPTLEEVLAGLPEERFVIEIKPNAPALVDDVTQILDDTGAVGRAMVASQWDDVLLEMRAVRPDVLTSMGAGEIVTFFALLPEAEASYEPPAPTIQAPSDIVNDTFVAKADRVGVAVHAWTVNERAEMEQLLAIDVHGIITDDPVLLAEVLDGR